MYIGILRSKINTERKMNKMTLQQKQCLHGCRLMLREFFKNDFSGHDYFHTERVEIIAGQLADGEPGVDLFRLGLTALLHDVDDRKISPNTTSTLYNADYFMRKYPDAVSSELRKAILEDIRALPYSGGQIPTSLEGKCVQDADRIDALGAIGIARLFAFGGAYHIKLWDPDLPPTHRPGCDSTSVNHFTEKLLHIGDTLNTEKGKAIAAQRTQYMTEYLNILKAELLCEPSV